MGRNLAARAEQARGQIEKKPATLIEQIREMQPHYQLAMPKGAEAAQLVRDAMTCLRTTKKLDQCEADSVLGGLMTLAQLGLRPGVGALGHGWLIPFWDSNAGPKNAQGNPMGAYRAQLIIGYQGYAELAYRTGRVLNIAPRTVYQCDRFELEYGLEGDTLRHVPFLDGPRGAARLYYAVARLVGGGYGVTDPMTQADMESHRDKYAMAKGKDKETGETFITGPWRDHFEAMAHKTMVRRLAKLLPKSTELAYALAVDEGVRVDLSPDTAPDEATEHPVIGGEIAPGDQQSALEPPPADEDPDWPPVRRPGSGEAESEAS
ncbi:recombinase RecT [Nonomuraea sp. 10N515B]|uniref:recombinase RecT n=1 Tax=Nonomuraea sp. 10N515B TaxID=3457422 RepID=UPI003FCE16B0